jgi:adenylate kinase
LYVRADDVAETVEKRLETFHRETEPLKAFYAERGLLLTVEGQDEVADTTALVFEALKTVEA